MAIRYLAFMKECVAVPLLFFLTEVVDKMELKVTEFDVKKIQCNMLQAFLMFSKQYLYTVFSPRYKLELLIFFF